MFLILVFAKAICFTYLYSFYLWFVLMYLNWFRCFKFHMVHFRKEVFFVLCGFYFCIANTKHEHTFMTVIVNESLLFFVLFFLSVESKMKCKVKHSEYQERIVKQLQVYINFMALISFSDIFIICTLFAYQYSKINCVFYIKYPIYHVNSAVISR